MCLLHWPPNIWLVVTSIYHFNLHIPSALQSVFTPALKSQETESLTQVTADNILDIISVLGSILFLHIGRHPVLLLQNNIYQAPSFFSHVNLKALKHN